MKSSSLTANKRSFSDLLKLFKDDNREELTQYFPIQNWTRFKYIDKKNEIKIGIGRCFCWKWRRGHYIGSINIEKKISSLNKKITASLYFEKSVNIEKEIYDNNLFYFYNDFYLELKQLNKIVRKPIHKKLFKDDLKRIEDKYRKQAKNFGWTMKYNLSFDNLKKRMKILDHHRKILKEARSIRGAKKGGRPIKSFNIFVHHLVNEFSFWKRDASKERKLLFDKNGNIRQKRYWDLICFVLIWIHFHIIPSGFEELKEFFEEHRNVATGDAWKKLKKWLQRNYSNFKPLSGGYFQKYLYEEGELLGHKKVFLNENGFRITEF